MGPELETKAPNLRVISPATVSEVAVARPTILFSLKVLIHVHPDELDEYFGNILTIIGNSGRAIIMGKWSAGSRFSLRGGLAHSQDLLTQTVGRKGGRLFVLSAEDSERTDIHNVAKAGTIEIRAAS